MSAAATDGTEYLSAAAEQIASCGSLHHHEDVTHQPEINTLEEAARSPLVMTYFALAVVLTVVELVIVIRRWKKLTVGQRIIFLVLFALPHPWCILFLELFLMQEQNRRYLRQKEELAQEKTRVAVMQMRPHFRGCIHKVPHTIWTALLPPLCVKIS